jgi:hypothetical protein
MLHVRNRDKILELAQSRHETPIANLYRVPQLPPTNSQEGSVGEMAARGWEMRPVHCAGRETASGGCAVAIVQHPQPVARLIGRLIQSLDERLGDEDELGRHADLAQVCS